VTVLFTDEVSFYRQPSQAWLWAPLGRAQPRLPYGHRANTLMRIVGVLDAMSAQVRVWDFPRVTADRLARCWKQLGSCYPQARKIYLVTDNWPVHFHPKVQAALATEPRIEVLPLPTYAPWLNNIEKLWRWVKQRVTHAHPWCDDFLLFKQQVLAESQRLSAGSVELKRYCRLDKLFC
jgi:transposase